MNQSYIDNYDAPLARLHNGEINHLEFLKEANCTEQFRNWCRQGSLPEDEENAEIFFDMHGFEDSAIVKDILEPIEL